MQDFLLLQANNGYMLLLYVHCLSCSIYLSPSVCVCVCARAALLIQHAMYSHIVICGLSGSKIFFGIIS
jgi:hypothetical protein